MLFYGSIIFILIFIFFLRNKKTPLKLIRGFLKFKNYFSWKALALYSPVLPKPVAPSAV